MWSVPDGVIPVSVRMSVFSGNEGDLLPDPGDGSRGKDAPEGDGRHDERPSPEERSRIEDRVAAHLRLVAENGPEFYQAGVDPAGRQVNADFGTVEPEIGADGARSEVGPVPEDGIPHVVEVRHLRPVHEEAVFEFAGVSEDAPLAHDHVSPDK